MLSFTRESENCSLNSPSRAASTPMFHSAARTSASTSTGLRYVSASRSNAPWCTRSLCAGNGEGVEVLVAAGATGAATVDPELETEVAIVDVVF